LFSHRHLWPAANLVANLSRSSGSGKLKPIAKTIDWGGSSRQPNRMRAGISRVICSTANPVISYMMAPG
jgi:hypothetical protein